MRRGTKGNDSNRKTGANSQSNAEHTLAIENNEENTTAETTAESNNKNKQMENAESPEVTGEAGNGTPLNKPFIKKTLIGKNMS